MCTNTYTNRERFDKVIAKIKWCSCFCPTVYCKWLQNDSALNFVQCFLDHSVVVCLCVLHVSAVNSVVTCCRGSQVINKIKFKESIKEVVFCLLCHVVQRCLYLRAIPHLT